MKKCAQNLFIFHPFFLDVGCVSLWKARSVWRDYLNLSNWDYFNNNSFVNFIPLLILALVIKLEYGNDQNQQSSLRALKEFPTPLLQHCTQSVSHSHETSPYIPREALLRFRLGFYSCLNSTKHFEPIVLNMHKAVSCRGRTQLWLGGMDVQLVCCHEAARSHSCHPSVEQGNWDFISLRPPLLFLILSLCVASSYQGACRVENWSYNTFQSDL